MQQNFSFQASDSNGGADINTLQFLFDNAGGSAYACYFQVDQPGRRIWLRDNANGDWGNPVQPGQNATLSNSQCSLSAAVSTIGWSGYTLTVNLAITFFSAFAGTHNITMAAWDSTSSSGWMPRGTWTVGAATPAVGNRSATTGSGVPAGCSYGGPYFALTDGIERCNGFDVNNGSSNGSFTSCAVDGNNVTARVVAQDLFNLYVGYTASSSAATGSRTIRCVWTSYGNNYSVTAGTLAVADPTPVINAVQQLGDLYPGGQAYISIYGNNFGSGQGTLGLCVHGAADPCTGADIGYTITYWSQGQVNALLTAAPTALGTYDVQLTAATGALGVAFAPAPQQKSSPQSNRGQVQVRRPNPRIILGGVDVTGQTTTVVIGQQIALTISGLSGVTVQSFSWTIPSTPSNVYGFSNGQGGPPDNNTGQNDASTATQGGVTYYYSQAGTSTVTYTVNTQYSAQTTFTVVAPTYAINAQKGTVSVGGIEGIQQYLQYGVSTPGMTLTGTITPPQGYGAGSQQWVQLVPSSMDTLAKRVGAAPYQVCRSSGLDTRYPYTTSATLTDSPQETLDRSGLGPVEVTRADSFDTYLMWNPGTPNAIFVPLAHVTWSWSGDAILNTANNVWGLNPDNPPSNPDAVMQATSTFPTWSTNVTTNQVCGAN